MLSGRSVPFSFNVAEIQKPITVLFGAIGRHNFGDLLMAHVAAELLRQHCAVEDRDLVFADLLARDLRTWGGHNVQSVVSFAEAKFSNTTVNVVALGGDLLKLREYTLCCLFVPWISQLLKVGSLSFLSLRKPPRRDGIMFSRGCA